MLQYWDHWAQSQRLFRVCGMSCWQSGHGNSQWIDFVAFFSCCISCQRSGHKCKWGHVRRSATWPGCYSCCTKRICRRRLRSKVNSVKLPALSKQNIIYTKLLNNSLIFILSIHIWKATFLWWKPFKMIEIFLCQEGKILYIWDSVKVDLKLKRRMKIPR